jgi:hypothetical protein
MATNLGSRPLGVPAPVPTPPPPPKPSTSSKPSSGGGLTTAEKKELSGVLDEVSQALNGVVNSLSGVSQTGGFSGNTATTSTPTTPVTPKSTATFLSDYGIGEALLNDPIYGAELRAMKAAYDSGNFGLAAELYAASKFGKLDADAQNRYLTKVQNSDLYKERLTSWLIGIKRSLAERGLQATDAALEDYYIKGIDDATIFDQLASGITSAGAAGEIQSALQTLRSTAYANGFNLDTDYKDQINGWLQQIAKGKPVEDFQQLIRNNAKLGLPEKVGAFLDQGLNLADVYKPYKNVMANVLELTPDSIKLNDPILRQAYAGDKEMSLFDFQRALRKDPRWQYTDNAREDVSNALLGTLRDFGVQG